MRRGGRVGPPRPIRRRGGGLNMYYVYALKSKKNQKLYVGYSNDLKRRFFEHNLTNRKTNEWTKRNGPFKIIYYEGFVNKKDAQKEEKFLKSGYGREILKNKLKDTLD
jgi:putative endonuclease